MTFLQNVGLSHSEIFGSKVICTYPKLLAAYHVLHRLREPRHPPCALAYFLSNWLLRKLSITEMGNIGESTVWYILLALYFYFTFCTSCQRSFPIAGDVENNGFEPLTLCVQGRCSSPVSYTHLDVYKRQTLSSLSCSKLTPKIFRRFFNAARPLRAVNTIELSRCV